MLDDARRVRTDTGLGDALRTARVELGVYQHTVADRLGVTKQTVSYWERGRHPMPVSTALEVLDYYGPDVNDLMGRQH